MAYHTEDTICAVASAAGGAARGIVRISGPKAVAIASRLFEPSDRAVALSSVRSATAVPGLVRIPLDSSPREVPCDLFLWPTKRSYTREPIVELHTIGSRPVIESLVAAVCRAGARLAEPGEFTLRAFLAGRLDLTQAEAVLGVINARGDEELDAAMSQLAGGLARPLQRLREELLQLLAELEAGLDFVDEDIEFVSQRELLERLHAARELLENVEMQMASRYVVHEAAQIALVGPPNVGKSSLFNAIVERGRRLNGEGVRPADAALVSPQRGTTRDYLTAAVSLDGIACELVDTAGIETEAPAGDHDQKSTSDIHKAAQSHAMERRKRAAIRAYCVEASWYSAGRELGESRTPGEALDCELVVVTKSDLARKHRIDNLACGRLPVVVTSSRTGEGLDALCSVLRKLLMPDFGQPRGSVVSSTAERCRESIRLAARSIESAAEILKSAGGHELVADELRAALRELGKVVGAVYTDDLLDRIFSTFCIGK